jgi:CubicO group peptidase (beta-lactamase class C family)
MELKSIRTVILLLLSFSFKYVSAQSDIGITGKVVSSEDQQPIYGANITIDRKGVGTATNKSGNFALTIPGAYAKDSLKLSCIGYQTKHMAIAGIKPGQNLNITLIKNTTDLKEVSVGYRDPAKIIARALANIKQNYINHPHITRGFYRMYTANGKLPLELSEAVFDIYNFGYSDKRADLFKLIKTRDGKNQRDFNSLELGQKPNNIFNYDVVNHLASSGFLSEKGMPLHKFEVMGIIDVNGEDAYEIDFKELLTVKEELTYRGKFYVDTKTYAFLYFDYGLSPAGLVEARAGNYVTKILMGIDGVDVALKNENIKVSYQKVGDKMVLQGVVSTDALDVKSIAQKYDYTADVRLNYQVTAVDTAQTESFDKQLGRNENINDHDSNGDEEYWNSFNILLADFSTGDVFDQIKAINAGTKLKDKFVVKEKKMANDSVARLDALFKFYNDAEQFSGTVLVKDKGKIILNKSYGYADKNKKTPANGHTVYNLGTTAVAFTSVIVNQLADEKKIDLQTPVKNYLPDYKNGDITIDQLLSNQSGLADYMANDSIRTLVTNKSYTLTDMVVNFCSDTLMFKSGTKYEFSSANYAVLALVAQQVTGTSFATLLQDRIFTPLQMTDSYFGISVGGEHQAIAYINNKPAPVYDFGNLAGAGGVWSSAEDILKFHDALQGDKLLSKPAKAEMLKNRAEYKDYNAWYDYGWITDKGFFTASAKHLITYQTGKETGFYNIFARQEDNNNCVIILSNYGDFPRYDLTDLVFDILN